MSKRSKQARLSAMRTSVGRWDAVWLSWTFGFPCEEPGECLRIRGWAAVLPMSLLADRVTRASL
jgi:hypothetical protein